MKARLSAKGRVLLTGPIRKKMDLRPGDQLEVRVEGDRIMLIRRRIRLKKSRIVNDLITYFRPLPERQS